MINFDFFNKENSSKNSFAVHDISALLHEEMPCWPGDHHIYVHHYAKSIEKGDHANISRISLSMHTGSHIDAPFHKDCKGQRLDDMPEQFMGEAFVADLTDVKTSINKDNINGFDIKEGSVFLIKTKSSSCWETNSFDPDFIYIDKEAAAILVNKGIKAVGIDSLSIDSFKADFPYSHAVFFNSGVLVYEGLDLRGVKEGNYYFIGLPLKIKGAEGSPVRALLFEKMEKS